MIKKKNFHQLARKLFDQHGAKPYDQLVRSGAHKKPRPWGDVTTTRTSLRARLQISAAEVESILTVLADQADVTLENILRATRR